MNIEEENSVGNGPEPILEVSQMTEYKSHKLVNAEKIDIIIPSNLFSEDRANPPAEGGARIVFENNTYLNVDSTYFEKHNPVVGGYVVLYKDGYASFSPAEAFEEGYTDVNAPELKVEQSDYRDFGGAIKALKQGKMIMRTGWNGKHMFVFMQVPAEIKMDIVPNMQSLPESVKQEFGNRFSDPEDQIDAIYYNNQLALVQESNVISGWSPSGADVLAEDWVILD